MLCKVRAGERGFVEILHLLRLCLVLLSPWSRYTPVDDKTQKKRAQEATTVEQFRKSKKKRKQNVNSRKGAQTEQTDQVTKVILRKTVEGDQATTGFGSWTSFYSQCPLFLTIVVHIRHKARLLGALLATLLFVQGWIFFWVWSLLFSGNGRIIGFLETVWASFGEQTISKPARGLHRAPSHHTWGLHKTKCISKQHLSS